MVVNRKEQLVHNCYKNISNRILNLEGVVRNAIHHLERVDEKCNEERKGPICVRHEFIQDYALEFTIFHQPHNHYQISLPLETPLTTVDTTAIILRVVVHD